MKKLIWDVSLFTFVLFISLWSLFTDGTTSFLSDFIIMTALAGFIAVQFFALKKKINKRKRRHHSRIKLK